MRKPTKPSWIYAALAITFVLAAFGVRYYSSHRFRIVKVLDSPVELSIKQRIEQKGRYDIILPKGQWFDTGIWVRAPIWVDIGTYSDKANQPFSVRVGEKEFKAGLDPLGQFGASIFTTRYPEDKWKNEELRGNAVYVPRQEKIFLKVDDEAITDYLELWVDTNMIHAPKEATKTIPAEAEKLGKDWEYELIKMGKEWNFQVPNNGEWFDTGILITPAFKRQNFAWPRLAVRAELPNTNLDGDFDVQIGEKEFHRRMSHGPEHFEINFWLVDDDIGRTIRLRVPPEWRGSDDGKMLLLVKFEYTY